jgi:hypothetical protein
MVESIMIMKKPIIIAHSAFQGFPESCARLSHARQVAPGDDGCAVLNFPTSFQLRRLSSAYR